MSNSPPASHPVNGQHTQPVASRANGATVPVRIVNALTILLPFGALVVAIVLLWGKGVDWVHLSALLVMSFLTTLGITLGFHRLFTHRAFETTKPMQAILAVLGSMAVEGPLLKWVAMHRRHHQHSDEHEDPHSPHLHGHGFWGMLKGLWHAHMGWFFHAEIPELPRYVGDLQKQTLLRRISALFPLWVIVGMAIPALLGGLLTMSWSGAALGFLWGGLVRIFLVHHVTWSVNSICHLWGARPFESHDQSRNNWLLGVLAMGEGWHNNHHAFPTSARHGLRWWEIDVTWWILRLLAWLKLAWNIKLPEPDRMGAKRRVKRSSPSR